MKSIGWKHAPYDLGWFALSFARALVATTKRVGWKLHPCTSKPYRLYHVNYSIQINNMQATLPDY